LNFETVKCSGARTNRRVVGQYGRTVAFELFKLF
jgi:hypothetical protein